MSKIIISCADLVKKSAMAITYTRLKKIQPVVTPRMIVGDKSAKDKSKSHLIELVGTLKVNSDFDLKYTFDEILDNHDHFVLIEHKHFDADEIEDWFLKSSLLQTAFYNALVTLNNNKTYITANYELAKGNPRYEIVIDKPVVSILDIKDKKYSVEVTDNPKLVGFYLKKAQATFDYTQARLHDDFYKSKEYETLSPFFTFKLLS